MNISMGYRCRYPKKHPFILQGFLPQPRQPLLRRRQGLQQATHLISPKDPGRINRRLLHCWLHKNRVYAGETGNPEPTVYVDADIGVNWFMEADYQPPPEVGDANPNKPGRGRKR